MKLLLALAILSMFLAASVASGERPTDDKFFGPRSIISDGQFNKLAFCTVLVMKMEVNAGEKSPATAKKWYDTMLFLADLKDDDPNLAVIMAGKLEQVIVIEEFSGLESLGRSYDKSCSQYFSTVSNFLAIIKGKH